MSSLHVLLKKEDLDPAQLTGRVVIVLDILFATSSIVHAFAKGVDSVWPAVDTDEANEVADRIGECVRAGEYLAERLPGFAPAMPLLLGREPLRGKALVYCTTNGTIALRRAAGAEAVYVGSLLNGAAVVDHVVREHPDSSLVIACSGSVGNFNMEDFYGAGHFVNHFERHGRYEMNDAARAARLFSLGCSAPTALLNSRLGLMMQTRNMTDEVEYCAQCDILSVVPRLDHGCVRQVAVSR